MATIRAAYKRTFQTKPFESQVVELSVEDEQPAVGPAAQALRAAALYRQLAEVGDALMADALGRPDPVGRK